MGRDRPSFTREKPPKRGKGGAIIRLQEKKRCDNLMKQGLVQVFHDKYSPVSNFLGPIQRTEIDGATQMSEQSE
jgi:hypothetical protein